MRYIIFGAGAIGGTIGAQLHIHGHDVVLIARGAHLEAMRLNGLLYRRPNKDLNLAIPVEASLKDSGPAPGDIIILTTKTVDSQAALEDIAFLGSEWPVVCAQNGVENERMASRFFDFVHGICVQVPARHTEPGVVVTFGEPKAGVLDVGRYPQGIDDVDRQVAQDLDNSGFSSRPAPDIMRTKYGKLVRNTANAVQALGGLESDDDLGALVADARAEAFHVLEVAGIPVAPDSELRERASGVFSTGVVSGEERGGNSTWQSLSKGKVRLESDYLNGEITLLGRLHGIPTPINRMLQEQSRLLAVGGGAVGSLSPAALRALAEAPL